MSRKKDEDAGFMADYQEIDEKPLSVLRHARIVPGDILRSFLVPLKHGSSLAKSTRRHGYVTGNTLAHERQGKGETDRSDMMKYKVFDRNRTTVLGGREMKREGAETESDREKKERNETGNYQNMENKRLRKRQKAGRERGREEIEKCVESDRKGKEKALGKEFKIEEEKADRN